MHRVELGQRIGKRVVTMLLGQDAKSHWMIEATCDCGDKLIVAENAVIDSTQCAHCAGAGRRVTQKVVEGAVYGGRTVLYEDGHINTHRAVMTRCECGKEQRIPFFWLRQGRGLWCKACKANQRRDAKTGRLKPKA